MNQLTDQEIYVMWRNKTSDRRYLRRRRWNLVKEVIETYKVKKVLEFGSGISTLLFDNLGLQVVSFETDYDMIKFVQPLCSDNVTFVHWDNENFGAFGRFDLALVDGINPRTKQLAAAIDHASLIAIDDFVGRTRNQLMPQLTNFRKISDEPAFLSIFERVN